VHLVGFSIVRGNAYVVSARKPNGRRLLDWTEAQMGEQNIEMCLKG
jgi:phage portal protein BeeE